MEKRYVLLTRFTFGDSWDVSCYSPESETLKDCKSAKKFVCCDFDCRKFKRHYRIKRIA